MTRPGLDGDLHFALLNDLGGRDHEVIRVGIGTQNLGVDKIITVDSPCCRNPLFLEAPTSGAWQTWSWGLGVTENCSPSGCP